MQLEALLTGGGGAPLSIHYSDVHPLWGGVAVSLAPDLQYERTEYAKGGAALRGTRKRVGEEQLRQVVRLLLEIEAWEQRTPERMPVPDEGRAMLTVGAGEIVTSVWEWTHEMGANNRLSRVREALVAIGDQGAS